MTVLAALTLFANDPASSYDRPAVAELTPFAGFAFGGEFEDQDTGSNLDLDDGNLYGLTFNFWARDNTEWEVYYSRQETELDTTGTSATQPALDMDVDYLHVGGTFLFDGELARPYIVATIGASRFDPVPPGFDSETFFSWSIGGGLKMFPKERVGLRLEARVFGNLLDSDSRIFCQTGPQLNVCAVHVEGDVLWRWQATAGVIFRFGEGR